MISTRCSNCGLVNLSNENSCKRCATALTKSGPAERTTEKFSGLPWRKLLLILIVVAIVAIPFWVRQKRAARKQELAAAVKISTLFAKPVTVEAAGSLNDRNIPNAEAITLRDAGLLTITYEPVSEQASAPSSSAESNPILIRTMRPTYMARIRNQSELSFDSGGHSGHSRLGSI
jgi:hypothetical protein